MNYKQKYEDALDRAKVVYHDHRKDRYWRDWLIELFPELKENDSEDERIRKAIIAYISHGQHCGVSNADMIVWLEKQGEKKFANKVEPKFKPGDCIIFNGVILHIDEVVNGYYRTISIGDGIHNSYDWNIDNAARLWTIQEAKDGVVLVDENNNIGIYSGEKDDLDWHSYIYLGCDNRLRGFSIGGYHNLKNTKPATKEQRDLLFQKIKEVGYEWDNEKKELKKIEPKMFNVELLISVLRKHLYTCVNKTNTYVRSEEDHITLSELINKIRADLIILINRKEVRNE